MAGNPVDFDFSPLKNDSSMLPPMYCPAVNLVSGRVPERCMANLASERTRLSASSRSQPGSRTVRTLNTSSCI